MRDVKRQSRAEARYLCPCHPWHSAVPTDQRMSTFLIQIVLLAGGAVYFGWTAAGALRSGEISVYVRANRARQFSRRANLADRWTAVFLISPLAMVAAAGDVIRGSWR